MTDKAPRFRLTGSQLQILVVTFVAVSVYIYFVLYSASAHSSLTTTALGDTSDRGRKDRYRHHSGDDNNDDGGTHQSNQHRQLSDGSVGVGVNTNRPTRRRQQRHRPYLSRARNSATRAGNLLKKNSLSIRDSSSKRAVERSSTAYAYHGETDPDSGGPIHSAERAVTESLKLSIGQDTLTVPERGTAIIGSAVKPDTSKMAATTDHHEFDSEKVVTLFESCKTENGELKIDCYNDAYEELCKIFKPLGAVFSFVTSDIVEKISILRDFRNSEYGDQYETIQHMVKYEVDNNLTIQKKKGSGCRTLLRLHRALQFITALLNRIRQTDNTCKFSHEVREAYDATLAHFHPWVIRKAVHVAMYTLPDRQHMLMKMKVEDTPNGMLKMGGLIAQMDAVYNITQELYDQNKLLDL